MSPDLILAVNGVAILFVASVAGILLYGTLLRGADPHDWHLLHAGGSGRGLMLIGLAAIADRPLLGPKLLLGSVAAIIFFAWMSTISMIITGITGERGFRQQGPAVNRIAHALYVIGAGVFFPGLAVFAYGLLCRLFA